MARLNIDEEFWTDPRLEFLTTTNSKVEAIGAIVLFWRTGQMYWRKNKSLIPLEIFEKIPLHEQIVNAGFAVVRAEGVYCSGADEKWDYLTREQQKAAGKKSAEARKRKFGTAQPVKKGQKTAKTIERKSNALELRSTNLEPYSSSSSSSSSSRSTSPLFRESDFRANEFIAEYCKRFKAKYNADAPIGGREAGLAQRLVKRLSRERAELFLDAFFSMPDAWLVKTKHPLGAFETKLNEVAVYSQTGSFMTQRQSHHADDLASSAMLLRKIDREGI